MRGTFKQTTNASFCNILSNYNLSRLGDLFDCFVKRTRTKPRRNKTTSSKSTGKECITCLKFGRKTTQKMKIGHKFLKKSRLWHYRWEELYKYKGHIYDLFWSFIMPYIMQTHTIYCQAQFRLASSVPVQLGTEISLNISVTPTPPHPPTHPTRASIFEPFLDYLGSWNLVWKLYWTKPGQLANWLATS